MTLTFISSHIEILKLTLKLLGLISTIYGIKNETKAFIQSRVHEGFRFSLLTACF